VWPLATHSGHLFVFNDPKRRLDRAKEISFGNRFIPRLRILTGTLATLPPLHSRMARCQQ